MSMSSEEFNRLTGELMRDLPITLVTTRLLLALRRVVDAGGDESSSALRSYCNERLRKDDFAHWVEGGE